MPRKRYNLAIETATADGGVALGCGDELLAAEQLPAQQRHAIGLLPAVDRLTREHGFAPSDAEHIYVSVGPGSFTGLRIGITAAKMLARLTGAKLVAVPTLDVIAENAPTDRPRVAVCLNAKRGQCFTGIYDRLDDRWARRVEPALLTPDQIAGHEPAALIGDAFVIEQLEWSPSIERLDPTLAVPCARVVWQLGRALAERSAFTEAYALAPTYVRLPDAEEKWRERQAAS